MKTSQLKLRTRLTILILAITTPIFWIVLAMVNSNAEHRLRQEATERLRETNQAIASNVSLWLDLHIRILKELTFMPDIISMDADRQAPVLDAVASTYPYFAIVHTTDLYGNDIVRSDGLELKNWSDRQWFKGAIAGSPITFESIVRRTTGKPAVAISMPIRDSSDEIVGVVQFNIELNNLTAEIEARQVGNAGYAYIVDVNNRVIAHPDPAYSTDLFDLSDYPPIVMLRNGQQGLINFEDDQGSLWQAYVEQLDNGWGIIVQQPEGELFSSLRVFQVTSLFFALSGTALLLLGSFFIVRRALKPIETLTDTVLAIAGGDLDRTAPVERMDEVGTLASAFNSMTTRIRELILSLEQRVDQLDQTHLALNESLLRQTAILDNIPDLAWLKDEESRFIAVNEPFGKACGVAPADIVGKTDLDIWPEELANGYQQDDFEVMRTGKRKEVEERLMDSSGSESWIETIKTPIFDANGEVIGTAGIARDITERKRSDAITRLRLRLFEYAANHYLGELLQKILDEVGELTGSPIGFYHFVGADQKTLSLQAWSTQTLENFCRAEGQGMHYSIDEAGVWVDCVRERKAVIHNDYVSLPHRKGLPDGHTPVIREMVVPILRHNRIVAILGVGNKSQDYTDQDAEIVTYLADVAWELAERKKIEEELRVSEQKFSKTFRSSPDSVTLSDLESGYLVEVNDGFQEVFGYSREEAIGRTTLELGLYQNPADRQKMVQTLREQGNISNLELTGVHKSGSVLTALLSVEMIEIGGKSHLITITRDITERKKAEEALRQANLVVESSPVMLFRWKAAEGWPVTLVSQNVMQLGYSAEELLSGSTSYTSIVHPDDLERVNREVQEYSVNGVNRFQQEYRIITKAGKVRWIDDRTVVEQDSDGQITHYQGIVVDITERKQAEDERKKLISKLEIKNAELERFTYTVSHDLKSPLITIRGFLGYLEKDAVEGNIERLKSDIERISKAAEKMQQLLDELLELSRIGRLMNEPEEVSFETIVLEAVNLVEGQLKEGNIEVEIGSDFPKVYGDRVRLVEVVQNLVDNAVKFTKEQPKPKIEIGARDNDRETSFYVKDNGIGIDPKYHKKIFSLFEKLDSSSEGTGVGLALVKRIVEVHGGRIWVESEAGEGATFCFTLSRTPKFE